MQKKDLLLALKQEAEKLCFLGPIISLLLKTGTDDNGQDQRHCLTYPKCLILAPTRELANQIHLKHERYDPIRLDPKLGFYGHIKVAVEKEKEKEKKKKKVVIPEPEDDGVEKNEYSVTTDANFQEVRNLREKLLNITHDEHIPCVLVGNKCDLNEDHEVQMSTGESLAKEFGWKFLEASAKTNVVASFEEIVKSIRGYRNGKDNNPGETAQPKQKPQKKRVCMLL